MKVLKTNNTFGFAQPTQRETAPRILEMFMWSNGADVASPDLKTVTVNINSGSWPAIEPNEESRELLTIVYKSKPEKEGVGRGFQEYFTMRIETDLSKIYSDCKLFGVYS